MSVYPLLQTDEVIGELHCDSRGRLRGRLRKLLLKAPISPYLRGPLPAADTTKPSGSAPAEYDPSALGWRLVARSLLLAERYRPDKPSADRQISPRESAFSSHYAAWAPARDIAGLHGSTCRNSCNQTASVRNALECDRTCRAVGGVRYPQNDSGGNRAACLAFRPLTS